MEIILAKNIGFCSGVKNAVKIVEQASKKFKKVYTYGPLMHNPLEVERLKKMNIYPIHHLRDIPHLNNCCLVIRTHGIEKKIFERLRNRKNIQLLDATCPFVKKIQRLVSKLDNVIIFGNKNHPEVKAILSYSKKNAIVAQNEISADKIETGNKIYSVVSQTTQPLAKFNHFIDLLSKKNIKFKIFNTICYETEKRQQEAKDIAKKVELMIVIGGKNSANANQLFQTANKYTKTILVEKDIPKNILKNVKKIGIISATSTPLWLIKKIIKRWRRTCIINN